MIPKILGFLTCNRDMQNTQKEWDLYFLKMAGLVASKSKDPSLKVGCVIIGPDHEVRSTGYNGFPRGVHYTDGRLERPRKYARIEHAERNAVYNAARVGIPLEGCVAYVVCDPIDRGGNAPCAECTRALIQAGISEIVEWKTPSIADDNANDWRAQLKYSISMLKEAGVTLREVDDIDER